MQKDDRKSQATHEMKLWSLYKETGDINIRNDLVLSLMSLVHYFSHKIANENEGMGIHAEDLVSDGVEAVMKGIEHYKPEKGTLKTYMTYCICNNMRESTFLKSVFNEPNRPVKPIRDVLSLDAPILADEDVLLADIFRDPDDKIHRWDIEMDLCEALLTLDAEEAFIVDAKVGVTMEPMSNRQIGEQLGCSHAWISIRYREIFQRLKTLLEGYEKG